MVWDGTCSDTFASSYAELLQREPGEVAALAEERKVAKYAHLSSLHLFTPVAVETTGIIGQLTRDFLKDLGRRLRHVMGEVKVHSYLLQRLSVAVQRGNAGAVMGILSRAIALNINFF